MKLSELSPRTVQVPIMVVEWFPKPTMKVRFLHLKLMTKGWSDKSEWITNCPICYCAVSYQLRDYHIQYHEIKDKKMSLYDLSFTDIDNNIVKMESFKGKVLLIVNTASKCGFTKQYEDLQSLHEKYKDEGLVIIGFPCNQFNSQEPGTNEEIKDFCTTNYNVTFLMSEKVDVRGENAHPIYKLLTEAADREVPWNFDKFVIGRLGRITGLSPDETSDTFEPFIKSLLGVAV